MVDFHLFRHFWLNLDHSMKKILEQLEFFTFAVKGHGITVDRGYGVVVLLVDSAYLSRRLPVC